MRTAYTENAHEFDAKNSCCLIQSCSASIVVDIVENQVSLSLKSAKKFSLLPMINTIFYLCTKLYFVQSHEPISNG